MENYSSPIIFLDSGIGGLPYFASVKNHYPSYNYVYIADSLNFPYGEKPKAQLRLILKDLATRILETFQPLAVVVSCNTATLNALDVFKSIFSCPIVGVQPILNESFLQNYPSPVGILATEGSVRQINEQHDISHKNLSLFPASSLVEFIEFHWISSSIEEKHIILKPFIQQILEKNIKTLMLSCTHFSHLKKEFSDLLPDVQCIDFIQESVESLAAQLSLQPHSTQGYAKLYQTNSARSEEYRCFCDLFGLSYSGIF